MHPVLTCACAALLLAGCGGPMSTEPPAVTGGVIIVTTERFVARSSSLPRFIEEKRRLGLRVTVGTEADYGARGLEGQPRAEAIRAWLQTAAGGHQSALLIGDGHPDLGEVPMFRLWARHEEPEDLCLRAFELDCRTQQSDLPYANLIANFDLNGNGRPGEHGLDDGPGGIDFNHQLVVGRIPVSFGDVAEADRVLDHAVAYTQQTAEEATYRRSVLLPASYYYFQNQKLADMTIIQDLDGADSAEWTVENVIKPRTDVAFHRLYEREGVAKSKHPSEGPISADSVIAHWSQGYGVVFWFGHGMPTRVSRTVWKEDSNGDGAADANELYAPTLIDARTAARLPAGKPAFVLTVSCEIGNASVPYNLSHALLLSGAAVGVIGSSSVTPGSQTGNAGAEGPLDEQAFGGDNAGGFVLERLLDGQPAAQAFAESKTALGKSRSAEAYAGAMMLNYFGDPTLKLGR